MESSTVAFLVIGQELLNGTKAEANVQFLAQNLYEIGADLRTVVFLPDNVDDIAEAINYHKKRCSFVITSGGLGAACNDVTITAAAKAHNQKVIRHTYLETLVSRFFKGVDLSAAQARLAEIPEGGQLLARDGMTFPQLYLDNIYFLPGDPKAFRQHFNFIKDLFVGTPWVRKELILHSIETKVTPMLVRATRLYPQVRFAFHPQTDEEHPEKKIIMVMIESKSQELTDQAVAEFTHNLPADAQAQSL